MRNIFILFFLVVASSFFTTSVSASVLKIETDFNVLHVGDVFVVEVVADTEMRTINAIETTIMFPAELLSYVSSDEGDSVVNLWIQKPKLNGSDRVSFSGITPGGFTQKKAPILALTFKVIKEGQANIEILDSTLLLNDGLGTADSVREENVHISVLAGDSKVVVNTVDEEIPEHFNPEIIQDPDVYSGKYALIFATADKGSGLDHFEVKEGWFGSYRVSESPYEVMHQALDRKIFIKAIDRMGNVRIEIINPQNAKPWYKHREIIATILLTCVLVLLGVLVLKRRFLRR